MPSEPELATKRVSRTHLLLYAILLVAGVLRLARLDLMAFEMDEGAACTYAARFAHLGLAPLLGVRTSLQFCNSPLFVYVLTPAFLATHDARLAAAMFALFGILAVYVVYRTGREFFSPAVGLIAAAMLAVSPAAVEYSRRLWGHSLIQVLCPVALYLTLRWVVAGRAKAVFWLALIIAAAQQFHFSGSLLWVQLILAYLLFRPKTDWVGGLMGLALGLVGYVPFLIEQFDTGFSDVRIMWDAIRHGSGQPVPSHLHALWYWFLAATDLGHNNFLQDDIRAFVKAIPVYRGVRLVAGAAWVGALVVCAIWAARDLRGPDKWRALREGRAARPLLFLTWSLVPLAVFMILRVMIVAPYFLLVYPAPFLAIGWVAVESARWIETSPARAKIRHAFRTALFLLLAVWVAEQAIFHIKFLTRLARDGGGKGSYASFGAQQAAMRFIALHAQGKTVVVNQEQSNPGKGIDIRFWFLLWTFDPKMQHYFPPDREKAEYWYIIRNGHYRVQPEFEQFLAGCRSVKRFGFLWIYVFPRSPGDPWQSFTAR
jgi:4-amino-4-deoxy-L-arabinose transferase-like glycosyltransferase